MNIGRSTTLFNRADAVEQRLCLSLNRACHHTGTRDAFRVVSRLGDGIFWYLLLLLVPILYADAGVRPALQMATMAVIGIGVYKLLKSRLVRERPYITYTGIRAGTAPLDRYSFPSGHTLHAVCFTTIATTHFPALGWVLVPFAGLVAMSRVVLGLHYPSDVLVGAALGFALASLGLTLY